MAVANNVKPAMVDQIEGRRVLIPMNVGAWLGQSPRSAKISKSGFEKSAFDGWCVRTNDQLVSRNARERGAVAIMASRGHCGSNSQDALNGKRVP